MSDFAFISTWYAHWSNVALKSHHEHPPESSEVAERKLMRRSYHEDIESSHVRRVFAPFAASIVVFAMCASAHAASLQFSVLVTELKDSTIGGEPTPFLFVAGGGIMPPQPGERAIVSLSFGFEDVTIEQNGNLSARYSAVRDDGREAFLSATARISTDAGSFVVDSLDSRFSVSLTNGMPARLDIDTSGPLGENFRLSAFDDTGNAIGFGNLGDPEATFASIVANRLRGEFVFVDGLAGELRGVLQPVPEPQAAVLFALGAFAIVYIARRRRTS